MSFVVSDSCVSLQVKVWISCFTVLHIWNILNVSTTNELVQSASICIQPINFIMSFLRHVWKKNTLTASKTAAVNKYRPHAWEQGEKNSSVFNINGDPQGPSTVRSDEQRSPGPDWLNILFNFWQTFPSSTVTSTTVLYYFFSFSFFFFRKVPCCWSL